MHKCTQLKEDSVWYRIKQLDKRLEVAFVEPLHWSLGGLNTEQGFGPEGDTSARGAAGTLKNAFLNHGLLTLGWCWLLDWRTALLQKKGNVIENCKCLTPLSLRPCVSPQAKKWVHMSVPITRRPLPSDKIWPSYS